MATKFESKDVDVEDWIDEGVSYLQAEVTIYRDPAMFAEYQPLLEKIKILEAEKAKITGPKRKKVNAPEESLGDEALEVAQAPAGEQALGEENPILAEIEQALTEAYAKADELWKAYSENTEVWTLRRLDDAEVDEVRQGMEEDGFTLPSPPNSIPAKASNQMKKSYATKMEAYLLNAAKFANELNLRCLAIGVLKVVVKGDEKKVPSLDGLRRLQARPGGQKHVGELVSALEALSVEDVAIMAPHREGAGA